MSEDFGTVRITYGDDNSEDLNKKLDDSASAFGGAFHSHAEEEDICIREYKFLDEDRADLFMENANFIISRHFPIEPIDAEEFPMRAQWGFDEAIYHHVEFDNMLVAQRFATWLRASFSTYLEIEMFDVFILNPVLEDGGPVVVYAFPLDSVLSGEVAPSEMEEINDLLASVNVKKGGNGGMLN
jgi:hypothetical protein